VAKKTKKTKSLTVAYGRGFKGLAMAGLAVVGTALAWRLANKFIDWLLGEGKTS